MRQFRTDHLTHTQFEEYCFDLLKAMGFVNVRWRKGTGLDSSPSDQGRDIECELVRTEIDRTVFTERWFVECKHYKVGVPPDKISGALTWAQAERPDVLLLIASNFFSNQTKLYLENYKSNSKPSSRIKLWELPELQANSKGKPLLLSKYSLAEELDFLNIMHPAHLEYIKRMQVNTLEYLFGCLDALDKDKRDAITNWLWEPIVQPRYREPAHDEETIGQLRLDPVDYDIFKRKCFAIKQSGVLGDVPLTSLIVGFLLQTNFGYGDTTSIDQLIANHKGMLEYVDGLEEVDPAKKKRLEGLRSVFEQRMYEVPDRVKDGYKLYTYFCDNVVTKLLEERPRL
jgi:hypothetical protein